MFIIEALFSNITISIEFIILLGAAITATGILYRYVWQPLRQFHRKVNMAMDSLLGYPPVLDPSTGTEIQSATPPLANRVLDLEQSHQTMVQALQAFARTHELVIDLQKQWEAKEKSAKSLLAEWHTWRERHEARSLDIEERLDQWEDWLESKFPQDTK